MADDFVIIAAARLDLAAADATFERLMHSSFCPPGHVDAVTIGRNRSGEVRFDREGVAGDFQPTVRIAAGLAAALYPSVGADLPASRSADRAVLNAVAGRVALAVGRAGMLELGEHLDFAPAAVIAVVSTGARGEILGVVDDVEGVMVRSVAIDVEGVERVTHAAFRSIRTSTRGTDVRPAG